MFPARTADSPLIVDRLREVGAGTLEEFTVRNYSADAAECVVELSVESDFADLFEVKEAGSSDAGKRAASRTVTH